MIKLYYAYSGLLSNCDTGDFIAQLPQHIKSKLNSLKRNEDKNLLLTALILLLKALDENGCNNFKLSELRYSKTGRPFFWDAQFDFNISHTDNCAAVAFSDNCRIGIDVEKIKEIDFSDFADYFTQEQWEDIYSAKDKYKRFYYYWTLIESGVKADGRGLSLIDTKSIKLRDYKLFINNTEWYYKHINFDRSISCCITTDKINQLYELRKIISI